MSYNHNQYNYQIAVIFAIVIGGCLLLAGVVIGIYYVCVVNMRDDKKRLTSSGRNSATNWAPQSQQFRDQPSSAIPYNPAPSVQNYEFGSQAGGPPRTPVNMTYTPVPSATPYNQPYSNMPLATPTNQQYIMQQNVPTYQPDVIYTTGPQQYMQQQPVEYTINQSPNQNYVQSSV